MSTSTSGGDGVDGEESMANQTVDTRIEHASFDEHVKQQEVQRLKFLLERTTIYSKFLADKLKKNEEDAAEAVPVAKSNTRKSSRKGASVVVEEEGEKMPFKQPSLITGGKLKGYQLEGVEWLVTLFENGLNGILADEMGLGKTVQCISFLAFLREQGVWGPFLIVAPLSTLQNWVAEFGRFAPKIPVLLYHGSREEREALRREKMTKEGPSFPVIVTSFEIAMNDRKFLQRHLWKYMIVDEGHRIKNLNCKLIKELKSLNTANRLLLTGTPLQNNLAELWSLLNFLLPDIFDDLESFQSWFDLGDLTVRLDEEAEVSILSNLHTILKPFLLRRLKTDVEQGIPPKKEYLVYGALSAAQQDLYQSILSRRRDTAAKEDSGLLADGKKRRLVAKGEFREAEESDPFTVTEEDDEEDKTDVSTGGELVVREAVKGSKSLQNILMQLRKACNHPYLFERPVNSADGLPSISEDLVSCSGKMRLLDQLLPALLARRHRVLIFSQMSRMLDILEDYMLLRGIKCCRIDGSVGQVERAGEIAAFNATGSDIPVFLLSTRAGGLGINLVTADTVIFYDSDWNPQMDLQAQDRVHRIGQTRPVLIYRLAIAASVESRILERAASKRRLEKLVIHQKQFKGRRQYYKDDRILLEDLEDILLDEENSRSRGDEGKACLSQEDLAVLLDRSEATFSPANATDGSAAFKVLEQVRADGLIN